jgi:hypothetical protein
VKKANLPILITTAIVNDNGRDQGANEPDLDAVPSVVDGNPTIEISGYNLQTILQADDKLVITLDMKPLIQFGLEHGIQIESPRVAGKDPIYEGTFAGCDADTPVEVLADRVMTEAADVLISEDTVDDLDTYGLPMWLKEELIGLEFEGTTIGDLDADLHEAITVAIRACFRSWKACDDKTKQAIIAAKKGGLSDHLCRSMVKYGAKQAMQDEYPEVDWDSACCGECGREFNEGEQRFTCPLCLKTMCAACYAEHHSGAGPMPCLEYLYGLVDSVTAGRLLKSASR